MSTDQVAQAPQESEQEPVRGRGGGLPSKWHDTELEPLWEPGDGTCDSGGLLVTQTGLSEACTSLATLEHRQPLAKMLMLPAREACTWAVCLTDLLSCRIAGQCREMSAVLEKTDQPDKYTFRESLSL